MELNPEKRQIGGFARLCAATILLTSIAAADALPVRTAFLRPLFETTQAYSRMGACGEAFVSDVTFARGGLPGAFTAQITVKTNATAGAFRQIFFLPVKAFVGRAVEGVGADGSVLTGLVPRTFRKDKWGFGGRFFREIRFCFDEGTVVFCAGKAGRISLRLGHYGGRTMELEFLREYPDWESRWKAGDTTIIDGAVEVRRVERSCL